MGRRTYIDASGNLIQPVTRALDTQRWKDLQGKTIKDLVRAHCSSCPGEACSGGYFAALAPEICAIASAASSSAKK